MPLLLQQLLLLLVLLLLALLLTVLVLVVVVLLPLLHVVAVLVPLGVLQPVPVVPVTFRRWHRGDGEWLLQLAVAAAGGESPCRWCATERRLLRALLLPTLAAADRWTPLQQSAMTATAGMSMLADRAIGRRAVVPRATENKKTTDGLATASQHGDGSCTAHVTACRAPTHCIVRRDATSSSTVSLGTFDATVSARRRSVVSFRTAARTGLGP